MSGHKCPADGCSLNVAPTMLMCRTHWYMTPKAMRDAVLGAWRGGLGAMSPSHRAACDAAIDAVNRRIAEGAAQ